MPAAFCAGADAACRFDFPQHCPLAALDVLISSGCACRRRCTSTLLWGCIDAIDVPTIPCFAGSDSEGEEVPLKGKATPEKDADSDSDQSTDDQNLGIVPKAATLQQQ